LLETHQLETLALEAAKDFAHQPPLHPIGLDREEGAFGGHGKGRRVIEPSSALGLPLGKQALG
jgi:hypothetical protein